MATRVSPFASFDKQQVLGRLRATGSHDPDVMERERRALLSAARFTWTAGSVLMFAGAWVCFTPLGLPGGLPLVAAASWLLQRGKRNQNAVREGFAEYRQQPFR